MADRSQTLVLIGAGPVGLCVAKALKAHNIDYEQLEADRDVGGNWLHGVYSNAHIISSRKTTEYPDFPSAVQMLEYLRDYAQNFGLRERIQFNTKVLMAQPLPDGRWKVDILGGERRLYKGLIVCNGHHWDRKLPSYPGVFTGEILHSKDYKSPSQLKGKRILVIGGGNSACDVASEAARVAESCSLSVRRGYWFLPKTILGIPSAELIKPWTPVWAQRLFLRAILRLILGRYEDYGLPKPDHKIFEAHPTINSELLHYIRHGRIEPKPDVARYDGNTVHFVDGTSEEFDLIVCGTGFHVSFPFLPEGLVHTRGGIADLYGGMFLPDCRNIYIIGTAQLRYGFGLVVTPGADLLAEMILLQDRMELPIGLVLKESGVKLPTTHLVDPHAAIRGIHRAKRMLPLLVWKEKRLRKKFAAPPLRAVDPVSVRIMRDMEVF